ncbi:hypothetical protein CMI44_00640 [Candidatus Pacearchaeota archaeon]|jgi:hypothetical protein|nr:hypothetical protein [Candidatus Pacearchaeota archaeon]|tara:strand:- start:497 stop:700 length:204 start_codon:yes stop_codon:yes gene_type:complete
MDLDILEETIILLGDFELLRRQEIVLGILWIIVLIRQIVLNGKFLKRKGDIKVVEVIEKVKCYRTID